MLTSKVGSIGSIMKDNTVKDHYKKMAGLQFQKVLNPTKVVHMFSKILDNFIYVTLK